MRLFILSLFLLLTLKTQSQVIVDDIDINKMEGLKTVQVLVVARFFSPNVRVIIDYGQKLNWRGLGSYVTDSEGKKQDFTGHIMVLNFMERNGWLHYETLALSRGSQIVYHFYFRKNEEDSKK